MKGITTKKALKIIGLALGIPIALILIIVIFVPGLPYYLYAHNKFPNAEISPLEFTAYDVQFEGETKQVEVEWVKAEVPIDFVEQKKSASVSRHPDDEDVSLLVLYPYYSEQNPEFDLYENLDVKGKDVEILFDSIGRPVPQTHFEFFYIINTLTWDDFKITKFFSSVWFYAFATMKEGIASTEYYYYENEHIKGFIFVTRNESGLDSYTGDFFTVEDGNKTATVSANVYDEEMAWAFFNSVRVPD